MIFNTKNSRPERLFFYKLLCPYRISTRNACALSCKSKYKSSLSFLSKREMTYRVSFFPESGSRIAASNGKGNLIPLNFVCLQMQLEAASVSTINRRILRSIRIIHDTVLVVLHVRMHFYIIIGGIPALKLLLCGC